MAKRILSLLLLGAMLVTGVPVFAAEEQTANQTTSGEQTATDVQETVDLDTLYVKDGLVSHFSVFGDNASTVNLSAGTWTDLVAGKTATFDVKTRWSVNSNGSVGFNSFYGKLDAEGAYVNDSVGLHASNVRLNFGLSMLPTVDYTIEYMAMYKPLYVYDANASDLIAKDAYGSKLETFDYNMETTGIFVHLLPVDALAWFQNLASAIDGVIWKDWRSGLSEDDVKATRSISHWTFGMNNGDSGGWYLDSSGRQGWWLGKSKCADGGLNVKGDVFQKNNVISVYGISVDETVTSAGDTEAVFSLYRDAAFYNSNEAQKDVNTTAKGMADGGYVADFDTSLCRFWLSCNRPTDFFGVRIYDRVLTDAERKQNRAVDVLQYYGIEIPENYVADSMVLDRVFDLASNEPFETNILAYFAKTAEIQNKVDACYPNFETLDELYVKDGLVALYTAFVGDDIYLTNSGKNIVWQNRLSYSPDATFEKAGWTYNTTMGGVGYDLIYGQIGKDGVFTSSYTGDTYSVGNMLRLDLDMLPKGDFTLEYAARYDLLYVYDAATDSLVLADDAGVTPPNNIVGQPVDVIGFLSSYTTKRGCYWSDVGKNTPAGGLRWRSVDKGGYKGWDNTYGMHGLDFGNRGSLQIGVYGITRDESVTGEGDTLVTSAVYTHYLNGAISKDKNGSNAIINATTEKTVGPGMYYHQDDDTEFYLSYKLGTTFYSLRLYNRVLSAAEQKQNRAVDLMRYYDVTLPEAVWEDEEALSAVYEEVATQSFVYDAVGYVAAKAAVQSVVSAAMHRDTLTDKFAQSEHLTLLFTVYCPETVDLAAGKWTDLVSGKTASFSYGGTNYWKKNADGSVGYTTFYGVVGADGAVVANSATDNYQKGGNRLQFGLSLLPESDFSVEYFAKYKPIYVYDANEADYIARADDGSLMETDDYMTRAVAYKNLQVEYPIDQLGWFTGITSVLDSTSHYWKKENQLQRGSVHWYFNCPDWYYETSTHQDSYVGSTGRSSHLPSSGLNNPKDAYQQNNVINTYGIYVDETLTVAADGTRTTTALFSLYRNAALYDSNAANPNSTANAFGGTFYYDIDTPLTSSHNFWLSSTRATDFFTVRIYDVALTDEEKQYNYAIDILLYYGIALTDEMWANDGYMAALIQRLLSETALADAVARAAKSVELQAISEALYKDITLVEEMTALYAKPENLTALFTIATPTAIDVANGVWVDYVGNNTAKLGNASKGYWQVRADGAIGYDVIWGEVSHDNIFSEESAHNNYKDYGTRLEFGIDLLPKGDFTVEYVAEYRPVYFVGPDGNIAGETASRTKTPGSQQYGQTQYAPVDFLGYLTSYTTNRDGNHAGRSYRGEVAWVIHSPVLPSSHWDHAYFAQTMMKGSDIFQTRNVIRSYAISRTKTTDNTGLVTANYALFRDAVSYNSVSMSRKDYEARMEETKNWTVAANGANPYNPPVITDFAVEDTGYFYLSERMSTDFYAVRIYNTALSAEEQAQNHLVDLIYFYDIALPEYVLTTEDLFLQLATSTTDIGFTSDAVAREEVLARFKEKLSVIEKLSADSTLYVKEGLVALYTAFTGDGALLTASGNNVIWRNRVFGNADATFEKTGWTYNTAMGGIGYDLIYGQIDGNGTFSASYAGNTYDNNNMLRLDLALLPKEDFTLEYVARYDSQYCYDARVGELVIAKQSGVSSATTPNHITQPVDVIGFLSSYTTHRGNIFESGRDKLRWRTVDKLGYKTWTNDYGMSGCDIENRISYEIGTYAITRDESVTGAGDTLVTNATYTHYLDGKIAKTIGNSDAKNIASSATTYGANRYFNHDDDTEFYLSYKLGTTFYALRIYDRVLTDAEKAQNRLADMIGYYDILVPENFTENEERYNYALSLAQTYVFAKTESEYNKAKTALQTAIAGSGKEVTIIVDGEETVLTVYGDTYLLPKTVDGMTLVAWRYEHADGTVTRCEPGELITLEDKTTLRALAITAPETKYGVTVKAMASDGFGMRFTASLDKQEYLALVEEYGAGYIRMGMLIAPKAYVDRAGAFTREALWKFVTSNAVDTSRAFVQIDARGFYAIDEDVYTLSGTLYKFSEKTMDKNPAFAAIAYLDIDTDKDGEVDKTVYGTFASNTCRTPRQAIESIEYMNIQMTDTQRKWVDAFMQKYEDKTYGNAGDKTVAEQRQEILDAFNAAMDTEVEYTVHEFAEGEVAAKYAHIKAISFDGLTVDGKKTRIFAYIGLPEGASAENPVPAMVLVHGGGGHAYMEWVRLWNERGYAAIAMENVGHFPVTPGAGVTDSNAVTAREFPQYILDVIDEEEYTIAPDRKMATTYKEVDEQWQYHGLSAVILSHNVLRQQAEVDSSLIGTIGVSWGGTMVSQVIGYDTRFAFAIPVYGTAYISEPERPFIGSAYVDDLWAAERNLNNFKNPIMWFAWADDNNFVMSSYTKSYLQSKQNNPLTTLVVLADWRHSHSYTWNKEHGYAFADAICFPDRMAEYPAFIKNPTGQNAASQVYLPEGATNVQVKIHYLTEPIVYTQFNKYGYGSYSYLSEEFKTDKTSLTIDPETGEITGTVPAEVYHYYISVTYTLNGKALETSSPFIAVR